MVQSYQNLQIDYPQVSANLLFELVQLQRAVASGIPVQSVPSSPINPNSQLSFSVTDSVVNGLWFTSLTLALATALLAVLTKQWLYQYSSLTLGTPRERCRLRQFRFQGLEIWKVALIIDLLPVLMHIALALFLAGLVIFLIPLSLEIAWTVGVITGMAYVFYVVSVLLPIWNPQCPYTIPLTIYLRDFWKLLRYSWHSLTNFGLSYESSESKVRTVVIRDIIRLSNPINSVLRRLYKSCYSILPNLLRHPKKFKSLIKARFRVHFKFFPTELHLRSHREHERAIVRQNGISIDAGAISWLFTVSSNPSVRRITAQSICGLPYGVSKSLSIEEDSVYQYLEEFSGLQEYSAVHAGILRRLVLSWLHYEERLSDEFLWLPDARKIRRHEPEFAELCTFLRKDPADALIQSLEGDRQEFGRPLTVWSFLFRNAEHRNALAVALLTWAPADNLFIWDDRNVAPVPEKEQLTLSQLSIRHPHIVGKWVFNYLCKYFEVSVDRKRSQFILLGERRYSRYSLFKTIYQALTQPSAESEFSKWNPFLVKISLLYLFRNFETYVTAHEFDLDDFGEFAKAFERDIIWSEAFFDDRFVVAQARVHGFQIYNILRKQHMGEPLPEQSIDRIYVYLVQTDASRWIPPTIARSTALHLLTGPSCPKFCKFLCTLQYPRLALILFHARQGITSSHAEMFVSIYKAANRNPSARLYYILYDPIVLEELCKGLAIADLSGYLLRIARLNPFNPNWRDCYRRLLVSIDEALESSVMHDREDIPPFYQAYRKEWFLLYCLCHHLGRILKVDLSGTEFTLRDLFSIFPQHTADRVNKLNALLHRQETVRPHYQFRYLFLKVLPVFV